MAKTIEQKYQKLTDIEHVLLRPGRYIGSVENKTETTWVPTFKGKTFEVIKIEKRTVTWNPGLLKLFDEIISNSVDHSKREEGKHLDAIRVEVDKKTGEITVTDNGGMPVIKHKDYNEYIPELVLGHLRAGSNFDDAEASEGTGQNGEGAALTNIFSTEFRVETSDGKNKVIIKWSDNMHTKSTPKVTPHDKGFTKVTYTPDYARLKCKMDEGNFVKLAKRVVDIAGCNPHLKVYLNGERILIKSFKDYVALYQEEYEYDQMDKWQVAVAHNDDGFEHISFVNSTQTNIGGTHVKNVSFLIAKELREFIKKKHKIDVMPSQIENHFRLFINATITNPRYSSQTKDDLITEVKNFGSTYVPSDSFIRKLTKSHVIQSILDWATAKAAVLEKQALRDMNKNVDKVNPKHLKKLQDAILAGKESTKCILFLCEGDSAAKVGKGTGDKEHMGFFALKGVPLNVRDADTDDIKKNKEFQEIMIATGLKIGEKVTSPKDLRYGMICMMSDADHDGSHITGLHLANLAHFWPELFELGMVARFVTPVVKVTVGKTVKSFFTMKEYEQWQYDNPDVKFSSRYYKGLSSSKDIDFKEYWANIDKHLIRITANQDSDMKMLDLVFGKEVGSADERKEWLGIEKKD